MPRLQATQSNKLRAKRRTVAHCQHATTPASTLKHATHQAMPTLASSRAAQWSGRQAMQQQQHTNSTTTRQTQQQTPPPLSNSSLCSSVQCAAWEMVRMQALQACTCATPSCVVVWYRHRARCTMRTAMQSPPIHIHTPSLLALSTAGSRNPSRSFFATAAAATAVALIVRSVWEHAFEVHLRLDNGSVRNNRVGVVGHGPVVVARRRRIDDAAEDAAKGDVAEAAAVNDLIGFERLVVRQHLSLLSAVGRHVTK